MPMNKTILGAALKDAAGNVDPQSYPDLDSYRTAVFEAMAGAIIDHIVALATVTVTVTSVSGVTTGAGVSGPGVGTGTIT